MPQTATDAADAEQPGSSSRLVRSASSRPASAGSRPARLQPDASPAGPSTRSSSSGGGGGKATHASSSAIAGGNEPLPQLLYAVAIEPLALLAACTGRCIRSYASQPVSLAAVQRVLQYFPDVLAVAYCGRQGVPQLATAAACSCLQRCCAHALLSGASDVLTKLGAKVHTLSDGRTVQDIDRDAGIRLREAR